MLSIAYFLAKFRFDTAENEPVSDAAVLDGGGGPPPRAPVATAPAAAGWLVRIKKPCRALLHRLAVQSLFFFFSILTLFQLFFRSSLLLFRLSIQSRPCLSRIALQVHCLWLRLILFNLGFCLLTYNLSFSSQCDFFRESACFFSDPK